jgi:hypothetical protein
MGGEAFRDTIRQAPDWVGYLLDRARQGRDLKKITERMEVFESFVAYYSFMPPAKEKENWPLLQSVAAEIGIPKHEIDRATKKRRAINLKTQDGVGFSANDAPEIDDLLKPLIVFLGSSDAREEIDQLPIGWWDYLKGADALQVVLDCDCNDSVLPAEVLGAKRKVEAAWASTGVPITFGDAIRNLEKAYIVKEMNFIEQSIKNHAMSLDHESRSRLNDRYAQLLQRVQQLQRSILSPRQ